MKNKTNRIIIILVLVILVVSAAFYLATYVWKVPELEYKYKKGEIYYTEEGKKQAWVLPSPPISRFRIKGSTVKEKDITVVEIKEITENGEYVISGLMVSSRHPNMTRKGDAVAMKPENMFLSSQPRFAEGRKRSWNKTIHYAIDNVTIPANYKIVRKILGRKNTYRIKTWWEKIKVDNQGNRYSTRLIGYSDFDAGEGKIIRMKTRLETRKNGKLFIKQDANWRLMNDEEIFKLSGLEKEWELMVSNGWGLDIARDGRLVYVKEKSIYVSKADGSNPVKIVDEGIRPKWSPDGNKIAYTRERVVGEKKHKAGTVEVLTKKDLFVINLEDKKEEFLCEKIIGQQYRWSPDSKWLGLYVGEKYFESEPMMVNVETKEVKKIGKDNYPLWYIDVFFTDKYGEQVERENIYVRWSHDGRYIAVGRYSPTRGLFIISRETKEEDMLIKADPRKEAFLPMCWSSDGKFIVFEHKNRIEDVDKMSYHIYSLEKRKIIDEIIKGKTAPRIGNFEWSYDNKYLYFETGSNIPKTIKGGIFRLRVPDEITKKISTGVNK